MNLSEFKKIIANVMRGPVFIVLLVFAVMVYSSFLFLGPIVLDASAHHSKSMLDVMQAGIDTELAGPKTILDDFSKFAIRLIVKGCSSEEMRDYALELGPAIPPEYEEFKDFHGLFIYSESFTDGTAFLSTVGQPLSPGFDPIETDWYRIAVAGGGAIVQTRPQITRYPDHSIFTYARCLLDKDGRRIGVAGIDVPLDRLKYEITGWGVIDEGYGILLDENLGIVAHPNTFFEGRDLLGISDGISDLALDLKNGNDVSGRRVIDYFRDNVIVFFKRLDNGWYAGIVQLYSKYNQNQKLILIWLILQGLILGAALTAILRYVSVAKKKADTRNQQKSNFLATMSHEIRTPLNAILGITDIKLQDDFLNQDVRDALFKIHNSGQLLLGIINDILDLSKIEAGKMELVPTKYQVAGMINDVVQLYRLRYEYKPIDFRLHVDENIPSVLIGDELRIKQILNNLLSNAFKYTDSGEVQFSVSVIFPAGGVAAHVTLVFRVSDTGQGMSEEQLKKLFDEYSRFNVEANRTTEGTGLGMSITKDLLQLMNGHIQVDSKTGKGTTVTIHLPQRNIGIGISGVLGKETAESLMSFQMNNASNLKKIQISRDPMSYGSVLIVDDVESNLYVAKGLMAPYGLNIDTVMSGFEAIEKIKAGKVYDIIFMDHMMPKMDGMEATKIMRGLGYTYPIVALTANALAGHAEMFLRNGFDGFISKPIDIRQLNASLNKLIRDKQPHDVIEAELKKTSAQNEAVSENSDSVKRNAPAAERPRPAVDPELLALFVQDADRVRSALEMVSHNEYRRTDDIKLYTINVHGIKSALANIGESGLSAFAYKLEKAGRDNEVEVLRNETPVFLKELETLVEGIKPVIKAAAGETVESIEDGALAGLLEKLQLLIMACSDFDKKTAKNLVSELKEGAWPSETREMLNTVADYLLHSEFEEVVAIVDKYTKKIGVS